MIVLSVVRVAQCEICAEQWFLPGQEIPEKCLFCGSRLWLYGLRTSRESAYIRQGISTTGKALNKGATSKARQDWGKKQFRRFKSKEDQPKPKEPA